jgi:hypothetical protein
MAGELFQATRKASFWPHNDQALGSMRFVFTHLFVAIVIPSPALRDQDFRKKLYFGLSSAPSTGFVFTLSFLRQ